LLHVGEYPAAVARFSAMRALVVVLLLAHAAGAAPCKQCVLELPKQLPAPMLVVLHGDRELATTAAARWRAAAKAHGWILLALQCPRDRGCKDSWWQWDGDARWIKDRVAAVGSAVDPDRVYLAGWSGGASYLGAHAQDWPDTFAAVVIHGGGMAPIAEACPVRDLPAYFLVGDRNPLHHLALALRAYFEGCAQDVVWDLVSGGDHDQEDRALDLRRASAILDWLMQRARGA